MDKTTIRRGTIVLCCIPRYENRSVQGDTRPAVVISNDTANAYSSVLSIVPLTGASKKWLPVHTVIESTVKRSIALCEQLTVIDKSRILRILGEVSDNELRGIERAVKVQLAM